MLDQELVVQFYRDIGNDVIQISQENHVLHYNNQWHTLAGITFTLQEPIPVYQHMDLLRLADLNEGTVLSETKVWFQLPQLIRGFDYEI